MSIHGTVIGTEAFRKKSLQKVKPERDNIYLELIEFEPCCCCYPWNYKDERIVPRYPAGGFAHHAGKRGKGTAQKCSDYQVVPICLKHHNECNAPNGGNKKVQKKYGVDFSEVWEHYRKKYDRKYSDEK